MTQSRTHTCGELRLRDAGKTVTLVGWMENVREVGASLAFAFCAISTVLRSSSLRAKK